MRDVEAVLSSSEVRDTLDLTRPVGLVLGALMHFLSDAEEPWRVVRSLLHALPSGSHVALSHACTDGADLSRAEAAMKFYRENKVSAPVTARASERILKFFDGLELLEPGLVPVAQWRPDPDTPKRADGMGFWCGVGRK